MQIGQRREEWRKWNGREKKRKRKEEKILASQNNISPAGASEYVRKGGRKKRIERGRMGGRKGGRLGF